MESDPSLSSLSRLEPCAVKVASTVLRGGDSAVMHRPYPTVRPVCAVARRTVVRLSSSNARKRYPLRGQTVHYIAPTDPVALDEWDALL